MTENKDRVISIIGAVGFHILLIVVLLVYYIKPSSDTRWSEELSGVPVMFGNIADAYGDDEPFGRGYNGQDDQTNEIDNATPEVAQAASSQAESRPQASDRSDVVSQDFEETVALNKAEEDRKKQEAIEAERVRQEKAEAARVAALEDQKKKEIASQMSGLFGNGTGSGSRGNTEGQGTQGVPTGNASYGKTSGVGGWGEYDLGGRGVGRGGLVKPSYSANDYGTVVVDIIVDPQGNVVSADVGRGTNTPSSTLKRDALNAARRTKFTVTNKPGNQKGTITYKFNLN